MKFDRSLDEVLGARSKLALLRLLARTRGEHTGRELARLVELDAKTCHAALRKLARQGVVEMRRAGKAILYRLNSRHVLVTRMLRPLFEREASVLSEYGRDLRRRIGTPLVSMILFGSVLRREERATSDVDLVLVVSGANAVRRAEEAVDRAAGELASLYGNPPQVIVYDRADFRRKAGTGDGFVTEVLRSGRVLEGKPIAEVLKNVS